MTTRNIQVLLTANNADLRRGLALAAADVDRFGSTVDNSNKKLMTGANLMKAGLAIGATAAAAGLAYASAKAVQFETAMRNVNSISGLTEEAFHQLGAQVVQMSRELPQSATTLAEGLYEISSSGFQGAEGMTVLRASAEAASAGLTTTDVAAKAISATLNAYGREAGDASDISDVLFQTVNLGVISFEELAGNLGDVVGGAAAAKVGIDEVGSAIAAMTLAGIGGAEATTSLNQLMTKTIQPSDALAKKLQELGYESGAQALETDGLAGVMEKLRVATGGNITTLLELYPEIRAARGALALMANEGKNYAGVVEKITDEEARAGATRRALTEQMKAVSAQMKLAKNQIDATAISVGTHLLPHLTTLLEVSGDVASEMKSGLGELGRALGPTWENLAEIIADVWDVLVDLGEAVGPVGAAMAKIGIGALVVGLNALTEVISTVTGMMADNEVVAMALAIAIGIHLMGGVAALTTKVGVGLVMAFVRVIDAMIAAQAAATATAGKMTLAAAGTAAATSGIALFVAAVAIGAKRGVDALNEYSDAVDRIGDAEGFESQVKAMREAADAGQALGDRYTELADRGLLRTIVRVDESIEALKLWEDGARDAAAEAQDYDLQLQRLQGNVVSYLAAESGLTGEAVVEAFGTAEASTKAFAEAMPMLEAAGVKVGDSYQEITEKVQAYRRSQEAGKGADADVIKAMGDLESGAKDADEALKDLKDALDRLMGVFMDADAATSAFEASLDDVAKTVQDNIKAHGAHGRSLDLDTAAGRANAEAIREMVGGLRDQIEAGARASEGSDVLGEKMRVGRQRILDAAEAAGLNAEEVRELTERYNLTPDLVETIIAAVGVPKTASELQAIQDAANNLDRSKPVVRVHAEVAEAEAILSKFEQRFLREHTNRVTVTATAPPVGDGPGRGGPTLSRVMPVLNRHGGYVTSTYRTPTQNRAAGGSPTSFHLDQNNPAVDIGGPTNVLDNVAARLRAMGGWRELLWRVPGHNDHIHVAHVGGQVAQSWPRMPGDGPHERTARLQVGEWVQTASSRAAETYGRGGPAPAPQVVQVPVPTSMTVVDVDGKLVGTMKVVARDESREPLRALAHGRR